MPARPARPTDIRAWLRQAAVRYHAGQVDADAYRRMIELVRRHADTDRMLDDHAQPRSHCERHPE